MKKLQVENGSFSATRSGSESDMRFLYCACAISTLLGDWSAVDKDLAVGYIRACTTYEGGVSLVPGPLIAQYKALMRADVRCACRERGARWVDVLCDRIITTDGTAANSTRRQ